MRGGEESSLPIEFHSIQLGGPAHGIVTKMVHKNSARGGRSLEVKGLGDKGLGRIGLFGI